MSAEELLVRTEQAAGDSNLYAWHQKLIEDGAELQKISAVRILITSRVNVLNPCLLGCGGR